MWSAVGGWGVSDYTYKIGIQNNVAYVNALRSYVYQRNELVFETTEVDFVKSKLQIEIDNSSDRDQVRFGKTLKPEQGLSIEQQFERISPLPFTDFTPSVKYETVRKIVQQLGLEE